MWYNATSSLIHLLPVSLSHWRWNICFEQVIEVPDRADIKHILRTHNASASCMSGSGSAIYGIFSCEEDAKKAKAELEKKYDKVYLCNRKNRGVEKISEE